MFMIKVKNKEVVFHIDGQKYSIITDETLIKIYKVREERLRAGFSDIAHIIYLNLYKQLLIIKKVSGESLRFYHQNHFGFKKELN